MEFSPKDCPAPNCDGKVDLEAFSTVELQEGTCSGWCNKCGQRFEAELIMEPADELMPVAPVTNTEAWRT